MYKASLPSLLAPVFRPSLLKSLPPSYNLAATRKISDFEFRKPQSAKKIIPASKRSTEDLTKRIGISRSRRLFAECSWHRAGLFNQPFHNHLEYHAFRISSFSLFCGGCWSTYCLYCLHRIQSYTARTRKLLPGRGSYVTVSMHSLGLE
jgi:hypothetical protein